MTKNLEIFPDDNKYFIIAEELWSNFEKVLKDLFSFLEVRKDFNPSKNVRTNPSGAPRIELLNDFVTGNRKIPIVSEKYPELMKYIRRGVHIFNLKDKPTMKEEIEQKLIEYYRKKNEGLGKITNRDLGEWWDWWE